MSLVEHFHAAAAGLPFDNTNITPVLRVPAHNPPPVQHDHRTSNGHGAHSPRMLMADKMLYDVTCGRTLGRIISHESSDTNSRFTTNLDIVVETRNNDGRMIAVRGRYNKAALYGHVLTIRSDFD
jgi:hypothetical protein